MDSRQYCHSTSQTKIELEEPEADATSEQSKSAYYYMFNRVYNQWQEATIEEKQEHEAIIDLKNSTKIPLFMCNFARFRSIMDILWDDSVYPFIEILEVVKSPYRVSENFIEAVKNVIENKFPSNLRKHDGTKIPIIEKDTAFMGDLFFAHVDQVSRQLFDLSSIQEKFNSSPLTYNLSTKNHSIQENIDNYNFVYGGASVIISSKFVFFSGSTFIYYREFHNKKERLMMIIEYLIANDLLYQPFGKVRFMKGAHKSYAMLPPNQVKKNDVSIRALAKLNLNISDYERIWQQCMLPTPELSAKIEKSAINHINLHLGDYISIIHRLGDANDPVAQEILKPGLQCGQIGINFTSNTFSLEPEHIVHFNCDNNIMKQLNELCIRATDQKVTLLNDTTSSTIYNDYMAQKVSDTVEISIPFTDGYNQLQGKKLSSVISTGISSNEYDQTNTLQKQVISNEEASASIILPNIENNSIDDCVFVMEKIKAILENDRNNVAYSPKGVTSIRQWLDNDQEHHKASMAINHLAQTVYNGGLSYEKSDNIGTNNNPTTDSSNPIEYDYPTTDSMMVNDIDHSLCVQQHPHKERFSQLSSSIIIECGCDKDNRNADYEYMETDYYSSIQTSSPCEIMELGRNNTLERSQESSNENNILPEKSDIITLSKRLMLKSFVTFTKTDATRLYNSAEIKNSVIKYLEEHEFIKQIDNLFLATSPTRKTVKPEIGYLKLFSVSRSASDAAAFEIKLREKVNITLDSYVRKVFNGGNSSISNSVINSLFNTAHHNWLLNRDWYDKLNEGHISIYYQNKIFCPDTNMSVTMVTVTSVSNDDVHDSFDRPRSKLTSLQRANKELRRLGAKRQKESSNEPLPKRQRKPKRFADDD
ncbi:unnamed protein product [Rotaria magnacalcarata]|uniref:Uncharacterized protein n=2 Tax=Rotaria magnacalcarata TaxID=392030 RepID=A0A814U838_9BILA|nr:unnamed protein product [Rotaria magnacalcarata]CAF1662326.1 unnamed protein product [Rotaria magnacalcarata]CAF3891438.1 unnamed protein product [Rotaria magnacalcarata]CAF4073074.1 unnamed protein product [Rotaria magnacalcarata]